MSFTKTRAFSDITIWHTFLFEGICYIKISDNCAVESSQICDFSWSDEVEVVVLG